MRAVILFLCLFLAGGCKLSKEESTLSRLHDEMQNKKKQPPPGSFTEKQVGLRFFPDADQFKSTEYDEGGFHIVEVGLSTDESTDKVRDFYEKEMGAKAMPMVPPVYSIQRDYNGKHYEVDYAKMNSTTITIKVSTPTN